MLAVIGFVFWAQFVGASPRLQDEYQPEAAFVEKLTEVVKGWLSFFRMIDQGMTPWVNRAQKERLRDRLVILEKDMHDIEMNKRFFIDVLQRTPFEAALVQRSADDLKTALQKLRQAGSAIEPDLVTSGSDKILQINRSLDDAVVVRLTWIDTVKGRLDRNQPVDLSQIIKDGQIAIKTLQDAREALKAAIKEMSPR